jgi:predicted  nucleic acid-binding Zn-ribbon protein
LLYVVLLVLVPLGLRYLASWHMSRLHLRLVHGDDDLRQMQSQCTALREDLIDTRRRLRQYQVRKTFIGNDICRERDRLDAVRLQTRTKGHNKADRMAA